MLKDKERVEKRANSNQNATEQSNQWKSAIHKKAMF